jgi:hypothetical protein
LRRRIDQSRSGCTAENLRFGGERVDRFDVADLDDPRLRLRGRALGLWQLVQIAREGEQRLDGIFLEQIRVVSGVLAAVFAISAMFILPLTRDRSGAFSWAMFSF